MSPQEPWRALMAAENQYLDALWDVREAGLEPQLRASLQDQMGNRMLMRLLLHEPPEQTMPFVAHLFPVATTINGRVARAREVIGRVNSGWLFIALRPLIAERLDAPEADYDDYRRIAEALEQWDQHKHLADLVARAETSDDPDVLEVAEDFRRTYLPPEDLHHGTPSG